MAITKYNENGEVLFKVYVHVRSSKHRGRRIQKTVKGIKTENLARREERRLIREASKEVQKMDGLGLLWEDVVDLWWEEVKAGYFSRISERAAKEYRSSVMSWTKQWNSRVASEISVADGRDILIRMEKKGLSRRYQKKVKNIINKVYEWGIEYKYIIGNDRPPMKGLLIDISVEKAPDILSVEEIRKFLSAAKTMNHHWYPVWSFAILTGMRSGELHALTWDQVDLEKNIIIVDRAYDSNLKRVGPTKGRYWRNVPINSDLRDLILNVKDGTIPISNPNHLDQGNHVLPRCKEWDNGDQAVSLRNFLESIGVKSIKFHALRACFATQMLANGVPSPIVMKIGGWKKSSTMDIYLRLAGVDTKGATDVLSF